ncbi:MAG: hypothetical protein SFU25_00270, partial [Candidatus Caenarcaniphilales bacterium]|nr:hypothetical protein [Candidatus Caenarcaniphilales bacterium]
MERVLIYLRVRIRFQYITNSFNTVVIGSIKKSLKFLKAFKNKSPQDLSKHPKRSSKIFHSSTHSFGKLLQNLSDVSPMTGKPIRIDLNSSDSQIGTIINKGEVLSIPIILKHFLETSGSNLLLRSGYINLDSFNQWLGQVCDSGRVTLLNALSVFSNLDVSNSPVVQKLLTD